MKTLPAFITTLTYLFLAGVAVLYVAVFAPNGAHAPDPKPFGFLQLRNRSLTTSPALFLMERRTLRPIAPFGQLLFARRASPRLLAYAVPVLMLFSLAWLAAVDFRFGIIRGWESYHFWIPVVEYIWCIQYAIFPL